MEPKTIECPSWEEVVRCASYDDLSGILPREIKSFLELNSKYTNIAYIQRAAAITLTRGKEILSQLETEIGNEKKRWKPLDREELRRISESIPPQRTGPSLGSLADTPPVALNKIQPPNVKEKYRCLKMVCDTLEGMAHSGTFDGRVEGNYFQGVYEGLTQR